MTLPTLPLTYRVQQPGVPSERPPLLFLLHGYGANEMDLLGLASYLDPRLLIISARAPLTLGPGSFAWFELSWQPSGLQANNAQAETARATLLNFIQEAITAFNADPAQVYLAGFSQGAIMSAEVLLTHPELVAGAVLMSGRIRREVLEQPIDPAQLEGKPVLVVHGLRDQVLPIANGRASKELLSQFPVALEYHEYPMAHEISSASLSTVVAWLQARLG